MGVNLQRGGQRGPDHCQVGIVGVAADQVVGLGARRALAPATQ
jgi:hypothetical protein